MVRIVLFLLIGLGIGGVSATVLLGLRSNAAPVPIAVAPALVPQTHILVAAHVVKAGTLLLAGDISSQEVTAEAIPAGAWTDGLDNRAAIQGALLRHQIEAGNPILHDDVIRPGERGFLAAVLEPGMRAATVGVDAVSGTAGLIWPGDRVDVILTQKMDEENTPSARRVAGEAVLHYARVIAVDQHMVEGEAPTNGVLTPVTTGQRTVTLEVLPRDAQKLAVATTLGHLALVVCSAADTKAAGNTASAAPVDPVVWGSDVSAAFRTSSGNPGGTVYVFEGAHAKPVEFHY